MYRDTSDNHPTDRQIAKPVVHLELHTADLACDRAFYQRLCGWQPEPIQTAGDPYVALSLGGRIGGGMVECPGRRRLWLPYVEVSDAAAMTERARMLGASVLLEPREGPGGWRSVIASPAGAEIALWQPKPG
jgi:predicted enzyme related to lactoylglutathione lyase